MAEERDGVTDAEVQAWLREARERPGSVDQALVALVDAADQTRKVHEVLRNRRMSTRDRTPCGCVLCRALVALVKGGDSDG